MKKIFVVSVSFVLLFYFLVYTGFFRNNSDPLAVANYYYSCMREGEWPLVYQVHSHEYFDYIKLSDDYDKLRMHLITKVKLVSFSIADKHAYILAQLTYNNGLSIKSVMELEKNGKSWFVTKVEYK